jgi:hypothetical protein
VRTTNPPYLKKRTQFSKSQVEYKPSNHKQLRPNGHLVTQDKTNPNEPNFPTLGGQTNPFQSQILIPRLKINGRQRNRQLRIWIYTKEASIRTTFGFEVKLDFLINDI